MKNSKRSKAMRAVWEKRKAKVEKPVEAVDGVAIDGMDKVYTKHEELAPIYIIGDVSMQRFQDELRSARENDERVSQEWIAVSQRYQEIADERYNARRRVDKARQAIIECARALANGSKQ
jgi:hypothetical protein